MSSAPTSVAAAPAMCSPASSPVALTHDAEEDAISAALAHAWDGVCEGGLGALEAAYHFRLPKSYCHADYVWPGVLMSREQVDAIRHLHFRPSDILIVSYPKSGALCGCRTHAWDGVCEGGLGALEAAYHFRLPKSYRHADYVWPGVLMSREQVDAIRHLHFRPSDILIVSFPKSGALCGCRTHAWDGVCEGGLGALEAAYHFRLPKSYRHADYVWPGVLMSREQVDAIRHLHFRPSDILIVSYPKSGALCGCRTHAWDGVCEGGLGALEAAYHFRLPKSYCHADYVWPGVLMSREQVDAIRHLHFRPSDILIVSYPKSGALCGCRTHAWDGVCEGGLGALEAAYHFRLPKSYCHADYVWPGVLMSREQVDAIRHLHFRPSDILIVSYPKSGALCGCRTHAWDGVCEGGLGALEAAYHFRLPKSYRHADYVWPGVLMRREQVDAIRHLHFRPSDILIVSYPTSGTTWVSEIVSLLCHDGDVERVKRTRLHDRVPWLELDHSNFWVRFYSVCQNLARMLGIKAVPAAGSAEDDDCRYPEGNNEDEGQNGAEDAQRQRQKRDADAEMERVKAGRPRRVFFTHMPLELLPTSALQGGCKIIYVSRNPKDNAVSFYHFHKMSRFLGLQETSWAEFFPLYTVGKIYCGSWFEHVLSFWRFSQVNPQMLFLKYEDMKKDLHAEVRRICRFVDIELDEATISGVVRHCSFGSMKDNKMANRDGVWAFNQSISKFMRKGVVGDWKNYFTVGQSALFDAVYAARMAAVPDLSFEFEPDDETQNVQPSAGFELAPPADDDDRRRRDGSTPDIIDR